MIAACIAALLFILALSLFESRERGLNCAPLPEVVAEERDRPALEALDSSKLAPPSETSNSQVAESDETRVRGRIIDSHVHMGVPWVDVEFRTSKQTARVHLGQDASFESPVALERGQLTIEVFDAERSYGITQIDSSKSPASAFLTIPIEIGPTYLVYRIGGVPAVARHGWRLRLVQSVRPIGTSGEIEVRDEELAFVERPDLVWSTVQLRFDGDSAFARWPSVEFQPTRDHLPRIDVRSEARFEVGVTAVEGTSGVLDLPDPRTQRFLSLSGRIESPGRDHVGLANVVIFPATDRRPRDVVRSPDFREVETKNGQFQVELRGEANYQAVAFGHGLEPRVYDGRLPSSGSTTLRIIDLAGLLPPTLAGVAHPLAAPMIEANTRQLVRARPQDTGSFARARVFDWPLQGENQAVPSTRYAVELIGVDRAPSSYGASWQQNLPGELAPPVPDLALKSRAHTIEWLDASTNRRRADFAVTAGPSGCLLTTQSWHGNVRFQLIPKSPMQFIAWPGGCEPIEIRGEEFSAREDEWVATIEPRPGWGVSIAFRVIDSVQHGSEPVGLKAKEPGQGFDLIELLAAPPLAGVHVESVQGRMGKSDADGHVLLRSRMWPPQLKLRAEGYRLRELQRIPGPGSRWVAFMEHDR